MFRRRSAFQPPYALQATPGRGRPVGLLAISIPHGMDAAFAAIAAEFSGENACPQHVPGLQPLSDFGQPPDSLAAAVRFKTSRGVPEVEPFGSVIIDLAEWHGGC